MCTLETPGAHNPTHFNATNSCTRLDKSQEFCLSFMPHPEFCLRLQAVIFVSTVPTPAVWPKEGTLFSVGGPCLSGASWSALRRLASVRSHEARRGVSGFGYFCRNKSGSSAGAKPGNTEPHVETRNRGQVCCGKFRAQVWESSPQVKDSRSRWNEWRQKFINNRIDPTIRRNGGWGLRMSQKTHRGKREPNQ